MLSPVGEGGAAPYKPVRNKEDVGEGLATRS